MSLLAPVWAGTPVADMVSDDAWLHAMAAVENALARAQHRLGVLDSPVQVSVDHLDAADLAVRAREAANPVVALVADLKRVAPCHLGSTSQDVLDSAAMLITGRVMDTVAADLTQVGTALAELVARHRCTPMAARTLGQHAVPTTFGLRAASWLLLVTDSLNRVRRLELPAQLGGAAGTLAGYREHGAGIELLTPFAEELGLAEPVLPWHTARTPIADAAAVLQFVSGALGKFALDVHTLARTEIGEVSEPFAVGRGASSAMPQKRNPVLATLIITAARQVPALTMVLAMSMLAEDDRPAGAWHAEWQPLREALRLVGGAAHTAVELALGLEIHPDRMAANLALTGPAIVSERIAASLGRTRAMDAIRTGAPLPPELLDPRNYLGEADALISRALGHWLRQQPAQPDLRQRVPMSPEGR